MLGEPPSPKNGRSQWNFCWCNLVGWNPGFFLTRPRLAAEFSLKNTRWVTGHQFLLMCCFFKPYKMYENRWVKYYLTLLFTAWGLSPWVELEATLSSEAVKGGFSYRVFACLGW